MENGCFENCENLKSITLPSTLIEIGYDPFGGCNKNLTIKIPENMNIDNIKGGEQLDGFNIVKIKNYIP